MSLTIESLLENSSLFLKNLNRDIIDHGNYGIVSKVQVTRNFALKDIKLGRFSSDIESELKCVFSEFQVMNKNLKNVVRSYDFLYDPRKKMFSYTMDLMDKTLDSHIRDLKNPLSFENAFPLLHNITTGKKIFNPIEEDIKCIK